MAEDDVSLSIWMYHTMCVLTIYNYVRAFFRTMFYFLANFKRLVFSCIVADLCNEILIFPRLWSSAGLTLHPFDRSQLQVLANFNKPFRMFIEYLARVARLLPSSSFYAAIFWKTGRTKLERKKMSIQYLRKLVKTPFKQRLRKDLGRTNSTPSQRPLQKYELPT